MLKLKLQNFSHLMQRADSMEKILMLGNTEGRRRNGWQRMRWLDDITDSMILSKLQEMVRDREAWCPWGHKESDTTDQLKNKFGNQIFIQKFSFKVMVLINVNTSHILWCGKTIKPDIAENMPPVTSPSDLFTVICLATLPEAHHTGPSTFLFLYGCQLDCLM